MAQVKGKTSFSLFGGYFHSYKGFYSQLSQKASWATLKFLYTIIWRKRPFKIQKKFFLQMYFNILIFKCCVNLDMIKLYLNKVLNCHKMQCLHPLLYCQRVTLMFWGKISFSNVNVIE